LQERQCEFEKMAVVNIWVKKKPQAKGVPGHLTIGTPQNRTVEKQKNNQKNKDGPQKGSAERGGEEYSKEGTMRGDED